LGGPNWYAYVENDPVNFVDPLGLEASDAQNAGTGIADVPESVPDDAPIWPVRGHGEEAVTSGFGDREDPFTGEREFHGGIDIGAPEGTDVLAIAAGQVVETGRNRPYGNYVVLEHGETTRSRYAHLESEPTVEEGQSVQRGQVLGDVGSTGRSTGSHLHFEYSVNGERRDPFSTVYGHGSYVVP
jgi:murein DD-endopeptidase MepM/ murein hydrolase activator NlpD